MSFQYELKLVRDDAGQVVFEESANYFDAFSLLAIGSVLLIAGALSFRAAYEHVSWRRPVGAALSTGTAVLLLSIPYFIRSRIVLDRVHQSLTVRRRLAGIHWTREYPIREIERVFDGGSVQEKTALLWLQLRNARTARLTMWAKRDSLALEEHQINSALKRFEESGSPEHARRREPMTEDEWWGHTKKNASVDLKRGLRRTLYVLSASVAVALALWPTFSGYPLHRYWRLIGVPLLLLDVALWMGLVSSVGSCVIQRDYVRKLKKIEEEESALGR
jgi:hypothetical protein